MNLFDIEQFVHMRIVRAYRKRLQPDPITLEDIKKRRGNGEALYSIAKDYGVGKEKLQKFCEEHNFKPPPVPWKDWEGLTLAVFELVKNGEEIKSTCEKFGISFGIFGKCCKRLRLDLEEAKKQGKIFNNKVKKHKYEG